MTHALSILRQSAELSVLYCTPCFYPQYKSPGLADRGFDSTEVAALEVILPDAMGRDCAEHRGGVDAVERCTACAPREMVHADLARVAGHLVSTSGGTTGARREERRRYLLYAGLSGSLGHFGPLLA